MDPFLVQKAVDYHGNEFLDLLDREQQLASFPVPTDVEFRPPDGDPNDLQFKDLLNGFITRKADILFRTRTEEEINKPPLYDRKTEDYYAVLPPIESFMNVALPDQRRHFYETLKPNDVFIGVVSAVQESGLLITLMCLDHGRQRDIDRLRIIAFCPVREVPRYYAHESPLDAFTIKDKVRGVVLHVESHTERIIVSLMTDALRPGVENVKIGLIGDEEIPLYYRRLLKISGRTYEDMMESILGFSNPNSVSYLCSTLGLSDNKPESLMRGLHNLHIPEHEYMENIKKAQTSKWALKSVAIGVNFFKEERYTEALQAFNKALDIDKENTEALVARGALYANNENYSLAINDFEKAISINSSHANARKYLCETLVVHGRIVEDSGSTDAAKEYYKRALELKPDFEEAKACLYHLEREEQKYHDTYGSHQKYETNPDLLPHQQTRQQTPPRQRNENRKLPASPRCMSPGGDISPEKKSPRPVPDDKDKNKKTADILLKLIQEDIHKNKRPYWKKRKGGRQDKKWGNQGEARPAPRQHDTYHMSKGRRNSSGYRQNQTGEQAGNSAHTERGTSHTSLEDVNYSDVRVGRSDSDNQRSSEGKRRYQDDREDERQDRKRQRGLLDVESDAKPEEKYARKRWQQDSSYGDRKYDLDREAQAYDRKRNVPTDRKRNEQTLNRDRHSGPKVTSSHGSQEECARQEPQKSISPERSSRQIDMFNDGTDETQSERVIGFKDEKNKEYQGYQPSKQHYEGGETSIYLNKYRDVDYRQLPSTSSSKSMNRGSEDHDPRREVYRLKRDQYDDQRSSQYDKKLATERQDYRHQHDDKVSTRSDQDSFSGEKTRQNRRRSTSSSSDSSTSTSRSRSLSQPHGRYSDSRKPYDSSHIRSGSSRRRETEERIVVKHVKERDLEYQRRGELRCERDEQDVKVQIKVENKRQAHRYDHHDSRQEHERTNYPPEKSRSNVSQQVIPSEDYHTKDGRKDYKDYSQKDSKIRNPYKPAGQRMGARYMANELFVKQLSGDKKEEEYLSIRKREPQQEATEQKVSSIYSEDESMSPSKGKMKKKKKKKEAKKVAKKKDYFNKLLEKKTGVRNSSPEAEKKMTLKSSETRLVPDTKSHPKDFKFHKDNPSREIERKRPSKWGPPLERTKTELDKPDSKFVPMKSKWDTSSDEEKPSTSKNLKDRKGMAQEGDHKTNKESKDSLEDMEKFLQALKAKKNAEKQLALKK